MLLHAFTMYVYNVFKCSDRSDDLYQSYTFVEDRSVIYCYFAGRKSVKNVFYEIITGHQSTIKHYILSKMNKQVYQVGCNSSFQ